MTKSIAVIGAGPGLGRAVARRFAAEGYTVVLAARRQDQLDRLGSELAAAGAAVRAMAVDLAQDGAGTRLARQIQAEVGTPDVVYYGPGMRGHIAATELTSTDLRPTMGMALYSLVDLVHEFLADMLAREQGAILTAAAPSAVAGVPQLSGTAGLAAQRNFLQALEGAVTGRHVYVGRLYIGAMIEHSAFHAQQQAARAAGQPVIDLPAVDPAELADLLWSMQARQDTHEVIYPAGR